MDFLKDNELAKRVTAWALEHRAAARGIAAGVVVILIAIIFVASLAGSIHSLQSNGKQLANQYQQFKEHVMSGDGENANQDAETIATLAEQLDRTTHGWAIGLACAFGGVDSDAAKARTLTDINLRLATEVTTPFAQSYLRFSQTGILNSDGSVNPIALATHPDAPGQLLEELRTLHPVISQCHEQIEQIGSAQDKSLQQVIESARTTLGQLDSSFTALDTALSTTGGIGDTITSLLP